MTRDGIRGAIIGLGDRVEFHQYINIDALADLLFSLQDRITLVEKRLDMLEAIEYHPV